MKKIYKYEIPLERMFKLPLPEGAKILSVQVQHGLPRLWAVVNPDNRMDERLFRIYGTGQPVETEVGERLEFVATFQMDAGNFIWHLFEVVG